MGSQRRNTNGKKEMINELGIKGDKFIRRAMRRDVKKVYDAFMKDKEHQEFYKAILIK